MNPIGVSSKYVQSRPSPPTSVQDELDLSSLPLPTVIFEAVMVGAGGMLRLQGSVGSNQQARLPAFAVDVQALDAEGAAKLLSVVRDVMARARVLVEYLDGHRQEARKNGVETVVIELSAIMEGGRLQDIEAALEEASKGGGKPEVTLEGFGKLRRSERLMLEAEESMARFRGPMGIIQSPMMGCSSCGSRSLGSIFAEIPTPIWILSIIGAGALAAGVFYLITKDRK